MAVAADLFLVHVVQQEVLRVLVLVGHARVDQGEVIGERPDVVVMVLGPARQVLARELAARPGDTERRLGGGATLDSVFQRGAKVVGIHERGHAGSSLGDGGLTFVYNIRTFAPRQYRLAQGMLGS